MCQVVASVVVRDTPCRAASHRATSLVAGIQGFEAFCVTLWNFCTLSDAQLHHFAFALYDADGDGSLGALGRRRDMAVTARATVA